MSYKGTEMKGTRETSSKTRGCVEHEGAEHEDVKGIRGTRGREPSQEKGSTHGEHKGIE
jgi:hypothetical protein